MTEPDIHNNTAGNQPTPSITDTPMAPSTPGTGVTADMSYHVATPFSKIADKVTGNNPTAILLLNLCDTYQQEIANLNDRLFKQSDNYQQQIDKIAEAFQKQIKDLDNKREGKEQEKIDKIDELHREIDDLIVANSFCKKLTPINIFGSVLTLLGTVTVGIAVSYDNWWLIIIFCVLSVLGSLLPTIFLYLSQIKKHTKKL